MSEARTILFHGKLEPLCSFALVNRRLVKGLRQAGYRVELALGNLPIELAEPPDVYIAHDHPYETSQAPGRRNLFFLQYDYASLLPADHSLVERLNAKFDEILAPSRFVRDVLLDSGVTIPVTLCPLGVDLSEFSPEVPPVELPTDKGFRFVNVGGANDRKGHDILIRAFREEFSDLDDVCLIVKSQGYENWLDWFQAILAEGKPGGPQILHFHGDVDSVAGFYTAAHCGVFPFRGEGFGLPILECLASGRPVIVPGGGGPDEYCGPFNAVRLRARLKKGKSHLEPDRVHLRRLLREAYETRGFHLDPGRIRASVEHLSWERTVEALIHGIRRAVPRARSPQAVAGGIGYAYGERGDVSWKLIARHIQRGLERRFEDFVPLPGGVCHRGGRLRALVGESDFALESFAAARRCSPGTPTILTRANGPLLESVAASNRERRLCGLDPIEPTPLKLWRARQETRLADTLVVFSEVSRRLFLKDGRSADSVLVLTLGIHARKRFTPPPKSGPLRFLFIGTDPFRKGVRPLFEAWNRVRPSNAELLCLVDTEILRSKLLLRHMVRNPSILVRPLVERKDLGAEYEAAACQILPSFEDGFSVAIAEGMGFGRPAIVSDSVGVAELLRPGVDSLLVRSGSIDELAEAIGQLCEAPAELARLGEAAFETARAHPWRRFEERFAELVATKAAAGGA